MVRCRQAGPVQHEISAVHPFSLSQIFLPPLHQPIEEHLVDRPVRFGHRQQARHGVPGTGRIHRSDESRHFPQHPRGRRPRFRDQVGASDQGTRLEIGLPSDWSEPVAFNGKSQQGDARRGH